MSTNWLGKLQLNFSVLFGRSVLIDWCHSGPFLVQKSFYPEDNTIPHVYLLHPSGGLVSGDKLVLDVYLNNNSQVLLTSAGATKFYRSSGLFSTIQQKFWLSNNSILEWLPQCSIFFTNTKSKINTTFFLERGSKLISFEMLCFGCPVVDKNFYLGEIDIISRIFFSGSIKLQERLRTNGLDFKIKLGNSKVSASFFVIPANIMILNQARKLIEIQEKYITAGGATLLDNILIVRLLGNDNQHLKKLLLHLWCVIRPIVIGRDVVFPRIWLT